MNELAAEQCEACRIGAAPVTDEELTKLQQSIPEWRVVTREGVRQLVRVFKFKNFLEAMAFTQKIADIAEAAGHHPALLTEWGQVTVSWWTHKIGGLHRNDFIMAAKTDQCSS